MAKKQVGLSFETDTLEKLDAMAEAQDVTRQALINTGIEMVLKGGAKSELLMLSVSQIACMDQLAARAGVSRVELMHRWLTQRLNREYVDDRNAKLQTAGVNGHA